MKKEKKKWTIDQIDRSTTQIKMDGKQVGEIWKKENEEFDDDRQKLNKMKHTDKQIKIWLIYKYHMNIWDQWESTTN